MQTTVGLQTIGNSQQATTVTYIRYTLPEAARSWTRKSRGGRLALGWQATAPAYQPIANSGGALAPINLKSKLNILFS